MHREKVWKCVCTRTFEHHSSVRHADRIHAHVTLCTCMNLLHTCMYVCVCVCAYETSASTHTRTCLCHFGSLSGKSWPMSGRQSAPRIASVTVCASTSPSLCAAHPLVCGISTPARTSFPTPVSSLCRSKPWPTRKGSAATDDDDVDDGASSDACACAAGRLARSCSVIRRRVCRMRSEGNAAVVAMFVCSMYDAAETHHH